MESVKKLSFTLLFATLVLAVHAQKDSTNRNTKNDKKEVRRQKISNMIRQAEEGVLVYSKQNIFGVQARNNGYGLFYELGKMKTVRKTNIYRIDLTEIKHEKEEKSSSGALLPLSSYVYGKLNNFYQVTLGFGQQHMLGQKGNKNGVAVSAVYNGGIALGLLKPYYLEVQDPGSGNNIVIKYTADNSDLFLGPTIIGSGGFGKGWNEIKMKPGVFAKSALRFDYGRYNELVSGIEAGISVEYYGSKIPIMAYQKEKQLFIQGYISILFGKRK